MSSFKKYSETDLITFIKQGNEIAIAELLERNKKKLFTAAYLMVKDQYVAEDIFQESCIKIIHSIRKGKYFEDGKFIAWAVRIARNMAIDYLRRAKRNYKVVLPNGKDIFEILPMFEKNKEDEIIANESSKTIRRLLEEIPYEQREVIVLRMYGNCSFKQIAEMTNVSINTALGRMRYGLINLKKEIEERNLVV